MKTFLVLIGWGVFVNRGAVLVPRQTCVQGNAHWFIPGSVDFEERPERGGGCNYLLLVDGPTAAFFSLASACCLALGLGVKGLTVTREWVRTEGEKTLEGMGS